MSSNERILNTLRAPHISEKAARLAEKNQYVFVVAPEATKADVRAAVEELFDVKVEQVNLVNTKGKVKSSVFALAAARASARPMCVSLMVRPSTSRSRPEPGVPRDGINYS